MKHAPQEESERRRLEPSKFSAEGFLGSDPRDVSEIIAEDQRMLDELRVDKQKVVESLTTIYSAAKAAQGAEVAIGKDLLAMFYESLGRIPSPFRGDGVFEKGEVALTHIPTGGKLYITALGINMIDRHGFFQGKGSRYRINPQDAMNIFGLCR
jgi:archaellum biogenesis protein FlaJ (TadC family)